MLAVPVSPFCRCRPARNPCFWFQYLRLEMNHFTPTLSQLPDYSILVVAHSMPLLQRPTSVECLNAGGRVLYAPAGGVVRGLGAALRRHAVHGDRDQGRSGEVHLVGAHQRQVLVSDEGSPPTSRWCGIRPRLHARRSDTRECDGDIESSVLMSFVCVCVCVCVVSFPVSVIRRLRCAPDFLQLCQRWSQP